VKQFDSVLSSVLATGDPDGQVQPLARQLFGSAGDEAAAGAAQLPAVTGAAQLLAVTDAAAGAAAAGAAAATGAAVGTAVDTGAAAGAAAAITGAAAAGVIKDVYINKLEKELASVKLELMEAHRENCFLKDGQWLDYPDLPAGPEPEPAGEPEPEREREPEPEPELILYSPSGEQIQLRRSARHS
jgi:hypothetical protein